MCWKSWNRASWGGRERHRRQNHAAVFKFGFGPDLVVAGGDRSRFASRNLTAVGIS
jgi:hypothetical protein